MPPPALYFRGTLHVKFRFEAVLAHGGQEWVFVMIGISPLCLLRTLISLLQLCRLLCLLCRCNMQRIPPANSLACAVHHTFMALELRPRLSYGTESGRSCTVSPFVTLLNPALLIPRKLVVLSFPVTIGHARTPAWMGERAARSVKPTLPFVVLPWRIAEPSLVVARSL